MSKNLVCLYAMLVLLAGATLSAQAQNRLTNGNFETGATTGWFSFGTGVTFAVDSTSPEEGASCGKITAAGSTSGFVHQKLWGTTHIKGKSYRLSGWIKTTLGSAGGFPTVGLAKYEKVANAWQPDAIVSLDIRDANVPAWTYFEGVFTDKYGPDTDPGTVPNTDFLSPRCVFDVTGLTGNTDIYIDDFKLEDVTITTDPNNLLSNPGFELGGTGWQQWPTAGFTKSLETTGVKEGTRALKVVYPEGGEGYVYQYYNGDKFYVGSKLTFSAWVKSSFASTNGYVALYRDIAINDTWGNYFGNAAQLDGDQAAWTKMEATLELPAGPAQGEVSPASSYLALRLAGSAAAVTGGDSTVYWDDVKLMVAGVPVELSAFEIE